MNSASDADLGDCEAIAPDGGCKAVGTLGSLGRFRANGPNTVHPTIGCAEYLPELSSPGTAVTKETSEDSVLFPVGGRESQPAAG